MSLLQFPDAINAPNVQIWNNAAFSTEEPNSEDTEKTSMKVSWCPLQPISINHSINQEPDSCKENRSPESQESFCKTPKPIKPLQSRTVNSQGKPLKPNLRNGFSSNQRENDKIEEGIKEIEKEIKKLSCKLAELRFQQAMMVEQRSKETEISCEETVSDSRNPAEKQQRRGRIVPAKFMDQRKISNSNSKPTVISEQQSGVTRRRGMSLGPVEIGAGFRQGRPEITPLKSIQNRRKSCYWKVPMDEIEEEKRGRSLSLSPKSQRSTVKNSEVKSRGYTVGAKKPARREAGPTSLQPKKLFREGSVKPAVEKSLKNARVVASRYNQIPPESDLRKRSLPESEKEESKRGEKKRGSFGEELYNGSTTFCHGKSSAPEYTTESCRRGKRRWETPGKINGVSKEKMKGNDGRKSSVESLPSPLLTAAELLPRIRTVRFECASVRDSGSVKRAADRNGKKSFFSADENGEEEEVIVQSLSFSEE